MSASRDPLYSHLKNIYSDGFTVLPSVFDKSVIHTAINRLSLLEDSLIPPDVASIPRLNLGHKVLYNLECKDLFFIRLILNSPQIINILKECLNDTWYKQIPKTDPNFILRAMIARSGGPTLLPLHIDSFIPNSGKLPFVMQVSVILEDQTINNGCTFCIPGSHKWDSYADNSVGHANVVPIPTSAGDVVVWDSRLHHGAFPNNSNSTRWSLIATFTRWWIKQNYQTPLGVPLSLKKELSNIEKSILGFCSSPPLNEFERIDIKAGYEILKDRNE